VKRIVVGLGNPGSRYAKTRHNMGWLVLDRLAERTGAVGRAKARDGAASVRGRLGDIELVLVKPTTYMNLSGPAVRKVLARERVPLEDMLVVLDEMSLPFGRLRMRERGSAGGHNGLRSIIGELGTEDFARLRVGIGAPKQDAVEHVLGDFAHAEQRHLDVVLDAAADAVEMWARAGASAAANRWNAWLLEPESSELAASGDGSRPEPDDQRSRTQRSEPVGQHSQTSPSEPADQGPGDRSPGPDDQGIVRTPTGWRRLLPEALRGRGDQGQR
jgi:PTH1 family peptidyl-tRNA hydrolase